MSKVTLNKPVPPPTTVTVEMTLGQAQHVAALLGAESGSVVREYIKQNPGVDFRRPDATELWASLKDALGTDHRRFDTSRSLILG